MKEAKYAISQEFYITENWSFTRAKVISINKIEEVNATQIKYKLRDVTGKEYVLTEKEIDERTSKSFDKAKELALQNLDALFKNLRGKVVATTKKKFDDEVKKFQKEQKVKAKKKKK